MPILAPRRRIGLKRGGARCKLASSTCADDCPNVARFHRIRRSTHRHCDGHSPDRRLRDARFAAFKVRHVPPLDGSGSMPPRESHRRLRPQATKLPRFLAGCFSATRSRSHDPDFPAPPARLPPNERGSLSIMFHDPESRLVGAARRVVSRESASPLTVGRHPGSRARQNSIQDEKRQGKPSGPRSPARGARTEHDRDLVASLRLGALVFGARHPGGPIVVGADAGVVLSAFFFFPGHHHRAPCLRPHIVLRWRRAGRARRAGVDYRILTCFTEASGRLSSLSSRASPPGEPK